MCLENWLLITRGQKNDVLRELAVDNKRTEEFLEFCCTDE